MHVRVSAEETTQEDIVDDMEIKCGAQANILRELKFEIAPTWLVQVIEEMIAKRLNIPKRARNGTVKVLPLFAIRENVTIARDSEGVLWIVYYKIDLRHHGFHDFTSVVSKIMKS